MVKANPSMARRSGCLPILVMVCVCVGACASDRAAVEKPSRRHGPAPRPAEPAPAPPPITADLVRAMCSLIDMDVRATSTLLAEGGRPPLPRVRGQLMGSFDGKGREFLRYYANEHARARLALFTHDERVEGAALEFRSPHWDETRAAVERAIGKPLAALPVVVPHVKAVWHTDFEGRFVSLWQGERSGSLTCTEADLPARATTAPAAGS